VKSLDDLADLAADELVELLPEAQLTEADAGRLIMAARAHWFGDEAAGAEGAGDAAGVPPVEDAAPAERAQ
jgi:N utilization substance protein A